MTGSSITSNRPGRFGGIAGAWLCATAGMAALGVLCCPAAADAQRTSTVRIGARIIKSQAGVPAIRPQVVVLDQPERWELEEGEASTGENAREYYFTLAASSELSAPRVEVRWPGVAVKRVIGADGKVEKVSEGIRFRMGGGEAQTKVLTMLQDGRNVYMAIFHNLEGRRAGSYRQGAWPDTGIRVHLNYLFAAREAARVMGLASAADPGFTGDVRLYGFETNFPNGHVDYPPHFHIMLGWPEWTGTQATHFRLDDSGRILENEFMVVDQGQVKNHTYKPGETCRCLDKQGRVGFTLTVEPDGHGVLWHWTGSQATYRLRGEKASEAVEVSRRAEGAQAWQPVCRVSADDDAEHGTLQVTVTPAGKQAHTEVVRYDPDTGEQLKAGQ